MRVNGIDLHHVEQGAGEAILCIHGTGGSALGWQDAAGRLARLGRVIAYDRRGSGQSERPDGYERTSVAEHVEDAAALLDALDAVPAVCIGRSYGGTVAATLALRHPGHVRAIVLLEGDAPRELAPAAAAWVDELAERLRGIAAESGVEAVGEALIEAVAGPDAWASLPEGLRGSLTANGPAILAEVSGEWWLPATADQLAELDCPALLVSASDSPPELREPTEALARVLPGARTSEVAGGHLIDPAAPAVLEFVAAALSR
jgi:pimeloyl-ACP methyl ester carboxylesterase